MAPSNLRFAPGTSVQMIRKIFPRISKSLKETFERPSRAKGISVYRNGILVLPKVEENRTGWGLI